MAAELAATGACEMFWFHGLSAGNRFVPRSVPRAVAIDIAMAQSKPSRQRTAFCTHKPYGDCHTLAKREQRGPEGFGDCGAVCPLTGPGGLAVRIDQSALPGDGDRQSRNIVFLHESGCGRFHRPQLIGQKPVSRQAGGGWFVIRQSHSPDAGGAGQGLEWMFQVSLFSIG